MFDLIDTAITGDQFLLALHDTLIMVAVSLGFGALIGVPLGIVLVVCRPGGIVANPVVHQALNPLINVLRSLPFIILLIVILPFTRLLVGTTIGTAGAIVPLIVFGAPYIARPSVCSAPQPWRVQWAAGESGIWLLPMAISASTLSPPSLPPWC